MERIKFKDKNYILIDTINYKNVEYLYVFEDISEQIKDEDIDNLKKQVNATANFIYKTEQNSNIYTNVTDSELFDSLIKIANKNILMGKNPII